VTLELVRRDATVRMLPKWLLVGALAASALEGVRTLQRLKSGPAAGQTEADLLFLIFLLWVPLACYLMFGKTNQRCGRFDLTLPLTAKRLWLTHLIAVISSGIAMLAIAAGVVSLRDKLVASIPGNIPVPDSGVGPLVAPFLSGLILASVVLQAPAPTLHRIRASRWSMAYSAATAIGLLALVVTLSLLPLALTLVPLIAALVLGWRTLRSLPEGFTLVPRGPEEPRLRIDSPQGDGAAEVGPSRDWPSVRSDRRRGLAREWFLLRIMFGLFLRGIAPGQLLKIPANVISAPILFFWGIVLSGILFGDEDIWFFFLLITVYMLLAFLAAPMAQLHLLDPLPLSRRRLFAMLALSGLLTMWAGYGAGRLWMIEKREPSSAVEFTTERSRLVPPLPTESGMIRVPIEYLEIAWSGHPPETRSPWGESHAPWSVPLFRGSRAVLYSPFSTPDESSPGFVALQLGRAIETVYGVSVPPEQIRDRVLETGESGEIVATPEALAELLPAADTHRRSTGSIFPLLFTAVGLLWLLVFWTYLKTFRSDKSEAARKWAFFGMLGLLLGLHLLQTASIILGFARVWVAAGVPKILLRHVGESIPGGQAVVWILCLIVLVTGYRMVESRFRRIEVPVPRIHPEI